MEVMENSFSATSVEKRAVFRNKGVGLLSKETYMESISTCEKGESSFPIAPVREEGV